MTVLNPCRTSVASLSPIFSCYSFSINYMLIRTLYNWKNNSPVFSEGQSLHFKPASKWPQTHLWQICTAVSCFLSAYTDIFSYLDLHPIIDLDLKSADFEAWEFHSLGNSLSIKFQHQKDEQFKRFPRLVPSNPYPEPRGLHYFQYSIFNMPYRLCLC